MFLIQVGVDIMGSGFGVVLRLMLEYGECMKKVRKEIEVVDEKGLLFMLVLYEEIKQYLLYFVVCIKEGLRVNFFVLNLFGCIIFEKGGIVIDGVYVF